MMEETRARAHRWAEVLGVACGKTAPPPQRSKLCLLGGRWVLIKGSRAAGLERVMDELSRLWREDVSGHFPGGPQ